MEAFHFAMRVRAGCCALIYRKALKLSRTALGESAAGKVVNLLSNDVSRFDVASVFVHHMWVAPTTAVIVMYLLWKEADYCGLIGMIPIFLICPLQSYTGKLTSKYRRQTAYKTDQRVRLMDEIVAGIQVIKMYAWEKPFEKIIHYARKSEINVITKVSYLRGVFMSFNLFTTRVALLFTLLAMVLLKREITAAKVSTYLDNM
ncbi:multidrug resistance-associated protein 4-like [Photinus pyralis]|uniref:multidrug resistance-associated protein 4-like n=1 Tax=Photinus pyralis TaxID=7054 RepID=UPI0012675821|nr:multidrug resistance-associated protein 4-like [Photinus pyralis]